LVLLITLDTVRADHVRCYGDAQIETPAIDALAADGIRYDKAYTAVPITLPSHAAILTGTYPMFNGVRDFTSPPLAASVPTLAEVLHRRGYETAGFVSSLVLSTMWGLNRGFEVYDDNVGLDTNRSRFLFLVARPGDRTTDRLLDWLGRSKGKPFFAWLHLYDAHSPYQSPEPYRSRYSGRPYDGAIAFDDSQVGRVVGRLKALNLYHRTLIVLLSDHGESLGEHGESEHGFFVYNSTLRVPLIVKLPGETAKSVTVSRPVSTVDVAWTIAQVCRLGPSDTKGFQGHSLVDPSLSRADDGRPADPTTAVYAESYYPLHSFGWHQLRSLVTSDFAYIDAPRPELYNLARDPQEESNLAGGSPVLASTLQAKLIEIEGKLASANPSDTRSQLDPETLAELKSLGYVAYKAPADAETSGNRADPKDKIATYNRILKASDLSGAQKYAEADELFQEIEREEPDLYVVPFSRGENLLSWGKPELALAEFEHALARNPTFDQAALGLGRAHFVLGHDEQAATAFELALHLNEQNFLARLALAKVHWRQNKLEQTEAELHDLVKSHPEIGEAHGDHGIVLATMRRYSEALPEIQRGIDLDFRPAIAYNYLGVSQAETGHPLDAIESYKKAIDVDPEYSVAYLNLALQYRKRGERAKALDFYHRFCELSEAMCADYASQFSSLSP
jgi:arylsulfatase A-like enzyme/Tfp pilus assembly protein PilF